MVDDVDHVTGETGLTPTVTLSKNGGAFAGAAGAVSEISNGWYSLAGNATDRETLGELLVHATATGADPVDIQYAIVEYDPFGFVDDGVALANDAITSAKFDESTAFPIKSADTGATQIARKGADSDTLETLSDQLDAAEPADVWAYASRTLTQSAASVAAAVAGDNITIIRGDTASIALTDIGSLANYSKIYFTVKNEETDVDTASIVMIEKGDGLKYINGAAAGTSSNGSITIDDEPTGDITIALAAAETLKLTIGAYEYDVQIVRSSGTAVSTLTNGTFIVSSDITRAIE